MKRRLPKRLLLILVLVAAGWLVHGYAERRAEARDRELAERLAGPLLPGVPDTGEPLWNVTLFGEDVEPLFIQGWAHATLGADLVLQTTTHADSFLGRTCWFVGAETPTASRFFESLLDDPDARAAWESAPVSGRAFLVVNGTATNRLPDNVRERGFVPLKSDGTGLRERLFSTLDAESARADVSFAEERLTAGVGIVLDNWPRDEKPGRFRRAVGWCCERLDFLPLDSFADWASEERTIPPDPTFPLKTQALSLDIREGRAAPCRMHQSGAKTIRQLNLSVDASAPLAASLRVLLAKHRPENLGCPHNPKEPVSHQSAEVTVLLPDRFEARAVPLADARFRAFLLDLLRLLATPSPGADEPHAESAESAEFESRAETAEGAEPGPHAESAE